MNVLEPGAVHVGVDLGGGYVYVAEEFLNYAKVRPARKQMGSETVSQSMRRDLAGNTHSTCVLNYQPPTVRPVHRPTGPRNKYSIR